MAFLACSIAIGQITPVLDGAKLIPLTTVAIQALPTPSKGEIQYSSDTDTIWTYNGTIWEDTGVAGGGSITSIGAGRTSPIVVTDIYGQTEANIITDGDPPADEFVICTDCAPAELITGTVLDMSGHKQIDDTAVDTATFTLTDIRTGGYVSILINEATEPAITGATNIPNTQAFVANKKMSLNVYVEADDTVWYTFTQLVL